MGLSFKNGGKLSDFDSNGKKKKKKKTSKKSSSSSKHDAPSHTASSSSASSTSASSTSDMSKKRGTGSVHHSSTIISGQDTRFLRELSQGDAFILKNPETNKDELRVIRFITSDTSLAISSAFSFPSSSSSSSFYYVKAPKKTKTKEELEAEATASFNESIDKAAGTTKAGTVELRIKNAGGGYNIIQQKVDSEMSREDLIDLRA
eukprot:CAMPEP_0118646966 /NCGR_PEP_ID=MMETSP0785-20121206/8351_1 /TAXON_ID=91992 /ORGANISM="Bolidomonas pacifica, Strain CCMP 1866" /LENGTH=204 /DNA_ID=CAMNT_0006539021 /DNA_START=147 /DNA_END=757 /DNA_ORIENTATION=-